MECSWDIYHKRHFVLSQIIPFLGKYKIYPISVAPGHITPRRHKTHSSVQNPSQIFEKRTEHNRRQSDTSKISLLYKLLHIYMEIARKYFQPRTTERRETKKVGGGMGTRRESCVCGWVFAGTFWVATANGVVPNLSWISLNQWSRTL